MQGHVKGQWFLERFKAHVQASGSLEVARDSLYGLLDEVEPLGEGVGVVLLAAHLAGLFIGTGSVMLSEDVDPFALTAQEAVDFFAAKDVVQKDVYYALEDQYRSQAFTASRVSDRQALDHLHASLSTALTGGDTYTEYLDQIDGKVAKIGMNESDGWYWSTVFQNNVQGAYNAGRWERQQSLRDTRPYIEYLAVKDSKTRRSHSQLDGTIRHIDDGFWATHYPINGHNCRCSTRSWSKAALEAAGRTVTEDENVPELSPDPGFSGNPGTRKGAQEAVQKLRDGLNARGLQATPGQSMRRDLDPARVQTLKTATGVDNSLQKALLDNAGRFQVSWDVPAPEAGQTVVQFSNFAQNEELLSSALTRILQNPALAPMKGRIQIGTRVGAQSGWKAQWMNPEVALEAGKGKPTAWWSELVVSAQVEGDELAHLMNFWRTNGQLKANGYRNPNPLKGAWDAMDLRVRGVVDELPEGMDWAYLNRSESADGFLEALSQAPMDGWDSERVALNTALLEVL